MQSCDKSGLCIILGEGENNNKKSSFQLILSLLKSKVGLLKKMEMCILQSRFVNRNGLSVVCVE